jgi:hypothetical protein
MMSQLPIRNDSDPNASSDIPGSYWEDTISAAAGTTTTTTTTTNLLYILLQQSQYSTNIIPDLPLLMTIPLLH